MWRKQVGTIYRASPSKSIDRPQKNSPTGKEKHKTSIQSTQYDYENQNYILIRDP